MFQPHRDVRTGTNTGTSAFCPKHSKSKSHLDRGREQRMSKMKQNLRNVRNVTVVIAGIIALSPVAILAAGTSKNVRGTITHVVGDTLEINQRDGKSDKVRLGDNAKIASVAAASLSDVKPGSFIGTAATPTTDGTLQAIEIHIFPESMRGTGEGNRAWDITPKSSMTNGTVAQKPNKIGENKVSKVEGSSLTVEYNGGTKVVTTTPNTKVVTLVPGDRSDLKPNASVFIPGVKKDADGVLQADRITVGKNGIAPPM